MTNASTPTRLVPHDPSNKCGIALLPDNDVLPRMEEVLATLQPARLHKLCRDNGSDASTKLDWGGERDRESKAGSIRHWQNVTVKALTIPSVCRLRSVRDGHFGRTDERGPGGSNLPDRAALHVSGG